MARREHDAVLLDAGDAAARAAVAGAGTLAHLDENQRAVGRVAHDEIDLAAAAARRSIIAARQHQARGLQVRQRGVLCRIAARLGAFAARGAACPRIGAVALRALVVLESSH